MHNNIKCFNFRFLSDTHFGSKKMSETFTILYYLKYGFSKRTLDNICYRNEKTKGSRSQRILQMYGIGEEFKGKLFLYEAKIIYKNIVKKVLQTQNQNISLNNLIEELPHPMLLDCYNNIAILIPEFNNDLNKKSNFIKNIKFLLKGLTANELNKFYKPLKDFVSKCEYADCEEKILEIAHRKETKDILLVKAIEEELKISRVLNLISVMEKFFILHKERKAICFLCENHHKHFDKLLKKGLKDSWNLFNRKIKSII
jgi:hypothetical protein